MDPKYSGELTAPVKKVTRKKYNPGMIFKIGKVVEAIYRREVDMGTSEDEIEQVIARTLEELDVEFEQVEIQHNLVVS